MKTFFTIIICFSAFIFNTENATAQQFPKMDASPMDLAMARPDRNTPPIARVIYSRPQMKGRKIFGNLVPYDKVWRTGANEATELNIFKPLKIGNNVLDPGTYTLYTIPGKDTWTIIINSDSNVWGTVYEEEHDIARITVDRKDAAAPAESLSMVFRPENNGTTLMIGWDTTYVEIPFKEVSN